MAHGLKFNDKQVFLPDFFFFFVGGGGVCVCFELLEKRMSST